MTNNFIEAFALSFIMLGCQQKNLNSEATKAEVETHKHWSYSGETGPEHWIEIERQSDCNGNAQSPINIIEIDVKTDADLKPLDIHYSNEVKIHDVTNNGHSIQYNFEQGDYILIDHEKYKLKQIHFHEASEHTIDGMRYPLEVHLVHVNLDNKIAVLATLAKEGVNSSAFDFLESYLPVEINETKTIDDFFDLNLLLPENKDYYHYGGSLTTPPCTQGVSWYVFKSPVVVSLDQVKQLQKLMPIDNYRNEQPLNSRLVTQMAVN